MTLTLSLSGLGRISYLCYRLIIGPKFAILVDESGAENSLGMPLYFAGHFFIIECLSSGSLLLNFGFTLKTKKRIVTISEQSDEGKSLRR